MAQCVRSNPCGDYVPGDGMEVVSMKGDTITAVCPAGFLSALASPVSCSRYACMHADVYICVHAYVYICVYICVMEGDTSVLRGS